MKKITPEERIFNLIEPSLHERSDSKYQTAEGLKFKVGLLTSIRTIIDEGTRIVDVPFEGRVS